MCNFACKPLTLHQSRRLLDHNVYIDPHRTEATFRVRTVAQIAKTLPEQLYYSFRDSRDSNNMSNFVSFLSGFLHSLACSHILIELT